MPAISVQTAKLPPKELAAHIASSPQLTFHRRIYPCLSCLGLPDPSPECITLNPETDTSSLSATLRKKVRKCGECLRSGKACCYALQEVEEDQLKEEMGGQQKREKVEGGELLGRGEVMVVIERTRNGRNPAPTIPDAEEERHLSAALSAAQPAEANDRPHAGGQTRIQAQPAAPQGPSARALRAQKRGRDDQTHPYSASDPARGSTAASEATSNGDPIAATGSGSGGGGEEEEKPKPKRARRGAKSGEGVKAEEEEDETKEAKVKVEVGGRVKREIKLKVEEEVEVKAEGEENVDPVTVGAKKGGRRTKGTGGG